jgi:ribose transport system permease protein
MPVWILAVVAALAAIFLHQSVMGRHLYALGRNEEAARYAGIHIDRLKIIAYVLSAGLSGFAGILYAFYTNTVQPATAGTMYELNAIAACVLGGCSLRGGEGTVLGILLGAAVTPFLRNFVSLSGLTDLLEYAIIGVVILLTVTADEIFKGRAQSKKARRT